MNQIPLPSVLLPALAALRLAAPAAASAQDPAAAAPVPASAIAEEFLASGDPSAAALEYRRLAADTADEAEAAKLHLLAAEAYRRAGDWDRMARMIDRAEDEGAASGTVATFLRLLLAEGREEWASSMLYAESLAEQAGRDGDDALRRYAASARAADALRAGRGDDALAATAGNPVLRRSVESYLAETGQSPKIGGLLGMIPGMGYAYSGEWGNMVRSMLLNGLFGWAMVETASHDQWALFSVATFFELTWYTGSIYGGIDAAHRANRERLESVAQGLREDPANELPATGPRLDLLRFRIEF